MELNRYIEKRLKEIKREMNYHLEEMDKDYEFKNYHYTEYLTNYYLYHELEDILRKSKGEDNE